MKPGPRLNTAARLSRALLACYPTAWQARYRDEVLDVLDQHHPTMRTALNLARNAAVAHVDPTYRTAGRTVSRVAVVLVAAFCVAGAIVAVAVAPDRGSGSMAGGIGIHGIAFSPDGRTVVVTTPSGTVWNVADPAHPTLLTSIDLNGGTPAFSPNGHVLAAGNDPVVLWNTTNPAHPTRISSLSTYPDLVRATLFSPDGHTLAAGYDDTLVLWNVRDPAHPVRLATLANNGNPASYQGPHTMTWMAIAFSADGHLLANASGNNNITLWDVTNPARTVRLATLPGHTAPIAAIAFSPHSKTLAAAGDDGQLDIWDLTDPLHPERTASLSVASAAQATSSVLAAGGSDTHIALAFAPDGSTLTTVVANATATRWNVRNPHAVTRMSVHTRQTLGSGDVAFSPDGRTLASAAADGSDAISLWNTQLPTN